VQQNWCLGLLVFRLLKWHSHLNSHSNEFISLNSHSVNVNFDQLRHIPICDSKYLRDYCVQCMCVITVGNLHCHALLPGLEFLLLTVYKLINEMLVM